MKLSEKTLLFYSIFSNIIKITQYSFLIKILSISLICSCILSEKESDQEKQVIIEQVDSTQLMPLLTKAYQCNTTHQLDSCIYFLNRTCSIYENRGDWIKAINILQEISWNYLLMSKFDAAIKHLNKGIGIGENKLEKDDLQGLRLCELYNNVGLVYDESDEIKKAMEYFDKAYNTLIYDTYLRDEMHAAGILRNISLCKLKEKDFDEAIDLVKNCLMKWITKLEYNNIHIAILYNHLANIYLSYKNYEDAYTYYDKSFMISHANLSFDHAFNKQMTRFLLNIKRDSTAKQKDLEDYKNILFILTKNLSVDSTNGTCNLSQIYTDSTILQKTIKYYFKPGMDNIYEHLVDQEDQEIKSNTYGDQLPTYASVGRKDHYILSLYYGSLHPSTHCHPSLNKRSDKNKIAEIEMFHSLKGVIKCLLILQSGKKKQTGL
ncbi:hypothetical protein JYT51_01735 [Candidatus Amoebophilus asiaticus]|nr:hypothetical protein [Candidatus Amoebophilus asiaticus]